MIVVGLSSGTSADGIDVAAAELTAGNGGELLYLRPLGDRTVPYPDELRTAVLDALPPAPTTMEAVCRLDTRIGQTFAAAAAGAIDELCGGRCDLVVSHGQTLYHWVEGRGASGTLQLGQPAWIAEATGVPVLSDVRSRDIAAGGHGAPLASTLDVPLLAAGPAAGPAAGTAPRAALNLGGIANVTVVGSDEPPIAFDVGPGNALLDAAARIALGGERDEGGRAAARGQVDDALLKMLLDHPYYQLEPPKSTGKETFNADYLRDVLRRAPAPAAPAIGADDLLATLVELTARTVADACRRAGVREVVASGGGVHNHALMDALARRLAPAELTTIDAWGLPVDAKEAYLFTVIGYLSWHGLPATAPGCTGAARTTVLGRFTPGRGPLRLPEPAGRRPRRLEVLR